MQHFMAGLELTNIMLLDVFLVLIKINARSYCRVNFQITNISFFSEWPKTNTLN